MFKQTLSTDHATQLVAQLKSLASDFAFHKATGKTLTQEQIHSDYTYLARNANEVLLTPDGQLNIANVERVEKSGAIVSLDKVKNELVLYVSGGHVRVPIFGGASSPLKECRGFKAGEMVVLAGTNSRGSILDDRLTLPFKCD